MVMEEVQMVDAPSDAAFWAGVGGGALVTVGVGWLILC
jgi:hypothetical protein